MPDQPTADTTRALIAEAEGAVAWMSDHDDWRPLIARLAAALSVHTREDADLDAIEARAANASPGPWSLQQSEWPEVMDAEDRWIVADWGEWMGPLTADRNAEFIAHAREDVPALLARVRTAEAERDEARAGWEAQSRIVTADLIGSARALLASRTVEPDDSSLPGCDGSDRCPAPAHQHGCFADTKGHCNEPDEHGERTVETAEEWEYAIDDGDAIVTRHARTLRDSEEYADELRAHGNEDVQILRRHQASPWEPVPPTPETGDPLSCADLGHEGPGQCEHPDHAPTPEEGDRA